MNVRISPLLRFFVLHNEIRATINLLTNRCRVTECGTASASLVRAQPEWIVKRTATMLRVSDIVSTDIDDKNEEIGEM